MTKWVIQDKQPTLFCYWNEERYGRGGLVTKLEDATVYTDEQKIEIGEVYYGMDTRWRKLEDAARDESKRNEDTERKRQNILAHNAAKEYMPDDYGVVEAQAQIDRVYETYHKKIYGKWGMDKGGGKVSHGTNNWLAEFLSLKNLQPEKVWEFILLRTIPPLPGQGPIGREHSSHARYFQFYKHLDWWVPRLMQVDVFTFPSRNNLLEYDLKGYYGTSEPFIGYTPLSLCRWLVVIAPKSSHGAYHSRSIMAMFQASGQNNLVDRVKYELDLWKGNVNNKD